MAMGWKKLDIRRDGFTLIEVMIALTIFSIGILSITGMLIIGARGIAGGGKSFTAVQAARAQMELLRGSVPENSISDACSTLSAPAIQCIWSVKKGDPAHGLSTIEIMATWYEGKRNRELVLTTLRFDGN